MAVGTGDVVRATAGVGVATLSGVGSGLVLSALRGLSGVAVARGVATGRTTTGAAGTCLGRAGGSAIRGALNGVGVGGLAVGGTGVGDGSDVAAIVGSAATTTGVGGATVGVGSSVGRGWAAKAAS
jgi:hypothetical protein